MMYIVKSAHKNFLWLLQFLALLTVGAWLASLAVGNILKAIYPETPRWVSDVQCIIGISPQSDTKCWQSRIKTLEDKFENQRRHREKEHRDLIKKQKKSHQEAMSFVENERQKLAGQLKKISRIESRFETVNLFTNRDTVYGRVATGVQYTNISTKPTYMNSWCNLHPRAGNILLLASHKAGEKVKIKIGLFDNYERLGTTRSKAKAALKSCVWPEGVNLGN